MDNQEVAAMHNDIASCWRDKCGRPGLADAHEARASQIMKVGSELTRYERELDRDGMMLDIAKKQIA